MSATTFVTIVSSVILSAQGALGSNVVLRRGTPLAPGEP